MPTRTTPADLKHLYRRLDQLLGATDGRRDTWLQGPFLEGLFDALREDLALRGARLYAERHGRLVRVREVGTFAADPGRELPLATLEAAADLESAPESAAASPATSPSIAMTVGSPPHRRLMLFEPSAETPHDRLALTLHAVGSAIEARRVESRLRGTMREAGEIQRSLLADRPPPVAGYDLAARSIAAEEVGGDFYEFLSLEPDLTGIAVGDASGHGLPAALLVRDVVTGLRMGAGHDLKVTAILERLNRVIHRSALSTRFVSVFYGELEANGTMLYVNAGHPPPLLFLDDRVEELNVGGTLLGPLREARFTRGFAHLDRGAVLVLYTDGVVERSNAEREEFGVERVRRAVEASRESPAAGILEAVLEAARAFGGDAPWEDDATLVVVKRATGG